MIPAQLRSRLRASAYAHIADLHEPEHMLRAVQDLADADPSDSVLRALVAPLHDYATALDELPAVVGDIRRGELVRWDAHTVTFIGHHAGTGVQVMVRTVRAGSRQPTWRRCLQRDARVLAELNSCKAVFVDGHWPMIWTALAGAPLFDLPSDSPQPIALRVVCRLVADLATRERAGLPLVHLGPHELRACTTGARVQCLTVDDGTRMNLGHVAADLLRSWPHADPLTHALQGLSELPAATASDLADELRRALASHLADARHAVVHSQRSRLRASRRTRLHALVRRLGRYGPPSGRGAVGVNLEGQPVLVIGDGQQISWGPPTGPFIQVLSERGLHPSAARRILRARAVSPPNPRLQAQVDGDEAFSEAVCRWIAAALGLRTLQLLLDVPA